MEVIEASTGVSIQVVALVLGGAIAFGVGALKWIDWRISSAADKLGTQILALDERYRDDRLVLEGRIVRLESRPEGQAQQWPRNHAMNGQ